MKLACANVARITRYAAVARHVVLQAGRSPKSSRSDTSGIQNPGGWLTTVVARVCLDMLRSRSSRREQPLGEPPGVHVPEPIVSRQEDGIDPEHEALLADSVGLALLVVLETLAPAERLAFVLRDMFAVPFEEIAPIVVGRSPTAARQLASRARRRVQGATPSPDADLARQREVVAAFLTAVHESGFEALLATLDPGVVLRSDGGLVRPGSSREVRGARHGRGCARLAARRHRGTTGAVNGAAGVVAFRHGRLWAVTGFTVRHGKIVEIDILVDPAPLRRLDLLALLDD